MIQFVKIMSLSIERGRDSKGIQNIRTVADVINNCNLGCHYCHPNFGWTGETLPVPQVEELFQASEDRGIFEVTLSGGEITMHPDFSRILEATHMLDKTTMTFVTNATKITPNIVNEIRNSNVGRICVSVDGPDAQTHNRRRGNNFNTVMKGLQDLQETDKPITVISVAHADNYSRLLDLSELLASKGLADQHHMCAPSFSGSAKRIYEQLSLKEPQFYELQGMIDVSYEEFKRRGLYITFNSFWPAIGERGQSQDPRTMTLVQFTEQIKDIYMIVRPNGDVRLTSAAWGRETVGDAVVGNLNDEEAATLFDRVDDIYRSGRVRQLPRIIEAGHKFHVGPYNVDPAQTIELISKKTEEEESLQWQPIRKLSEIDLLQNPFDERNIDVLAMQIAAEPKRWRVVNHASGVDVVYDRKTSHMTLLKADETEKLAQFYDRYNTSRQQ